MHGAWYALAQVGGGQFHEDMQRLLLLGSLTAPVGSRLLSSSPSLQRKSPSMTYGELPPEVDPEGDGTIEAEADEPAMDSAPAWAPEDPPGD